MTLPPLPKHVKGLLCDYDVINEVLDETNAGEHRLTKDGGEIRVTSILPPGMRWQTFGHELVHKWESEAGIKLKEDVVDRLASAMIADFIRNKWKLPGEK